jgi:hypothetical protein
VNETARDRAQAFVLFCDGMEEAGFGRYARQGRAIAAELLTALDTLEIERAGRVALQARCERLLGIVGKAAYRECVREALEA